MPHVVTSECDCSTNSCPCTDVCPVVSFHTNSERMVIDPDECIDCMMCAAECIRNAIFPDDKLPSSEKGQVEFNCNSASIWPAA